MARIEDLAAEISDPKLRKAIEDELKQLKKRTRFGLVFERHLPESVLLDPGVGLKEGSHVRLRSNQHSKDVLSVKSLNKRNAIVEAEDGSTETIPIKDLLLVKPFDEPIYPTLRTLGIETQGGEDRPHLAIEADNFHSLELLRFAYSGRIDCIYIDPPYNKPGAKDWKYNNHYIDENDVWLHSRWLSFMEKRLRLAKELLADDGVLIVTIDHYEQHRLRMLLDKLFPGFEISTIVIQHNPRGVQGDNFSRTHEFALFLTPKGKKLIKSAELDETSLSNFRNWGGESLRTDGKMTFYPVYINPKSEEVVGFGDVLPEDKHPNNVNEPGPDGTLAVWPIDGKGIERKWRYGIESVPGIKGQLVPKFSKRDDVWGIQIAKDHQKIKTVWVGERFDASVYGSQLLTSLIPESKFDFPKSLYAVYDCLKAVVGDRPNALVLDFFAGSGTTLHSLSLLNSVDDGQRQGIVVTNNEVEAKVARRLASENLFPGDSEYEAHGIFEHVMRPRLEAALTGKTTSGEELEGQYLTGRPLVEGFSETIDFLALEHLNPDRIELGLEWEALLPVMWLVAGARGSIPEEIDLKLGYSIPGDSFAVLEEMGKVGALVSALQEAGEVTHVFVLTDSEDAYAEVSRRLRGYETQMWPRDYLKFFREIVEGRL